MSVEQRTFGPYQERPGPGGVDRDYSGQYYPRFEWRHSVYRNWHVGETTIANLNPCKITVPRELLYRRLYAFYHFDSLADFTIRAQIVGSLDNNMVFEFPMVLFGLGTGGVGDAGGNDFTPPFDAVQIEQLSQSILTDTTLPSRADSWLVRSSYIYNTGPWMFVAIRADPTHITCAIDKVEIKINAGASATVDTTYVTNGIAHWGLAMASSNEPI